MAFCNPHELFPRDTVNANDTPGAVRMVQNKDSSGNLDGTFQVQMRVFNNVGSALVAGQVYLLQTSSTAGKVIQLVTGAALASVPRHYAVAIDTSADQTYCYVAIGGWVDTMVEGTTSVAAGDFLKFVAATSTTALIKDSSTTQSTGSWGRALAAQGSAGNTLTRCFLLGDPIVWG